MKVVNNFNEIPPGQSWGIGRRVYKQDILSILVKASEIATNLNDKSPIC